MGSLNTMFKWDKYTKSQKVFLGILLVILIAIGYVVSAALLTIKYMPASQATTTPALKNFFFYTLPMLAHYFSLSVPIQAISGGQVGIVCLYLASSCLVSVLIAIAGAFKLAKDKEEENIYGDTKWSTTADLEQAKLLSGGDKGIIVGKHEGKLLRFVSDEFCSLGAPTRSGKGTGIVIPNFMSLTENVVGLDIKGECYDYTSRYRSNVLGHNVFVFNPFSSQTHRYNPLEYMDYSSETIEIDLQNMAKSLYPTGVGGNDFFPTQAQSIYTCIAYLMGVLNDVGLLAATYTLTTLAGALNGLEIYTDVDNSERVDLQVVAESAKEWGLLTETIYNRFLSFFAQAEAKDQYTGIKASFEAPLGIFLDPLFENAMLTNDFDFRKLRMEKMDIYMVIPPNYQVVARPILSLFFQQLISENIKQGLPDQNPSIKEKVVLMMDEFTSMGCMEVYQSSVAYMAGYYLRSLIIYQSDAQLSERPPLGYGDKGAIVLLDNHTCNIIYRPKSVHTAEEISKRIGNVTINQNNRSYNNKEAMNVNRSEQKTSRALVLPQEIMDLADDEQLIFCNKAKIKCKKANYFSTPELIEKFKSTSEILRNAGKYPSHGDYKRAVQQGQLRIPYPNQKAAAKESLF
ncbi:TPA: type IV secretory system conjugative DNA transfer family protein [Yersinia enterocolitica]|nr:type IV secretory system conjugative DNA transfer family protein [Yersinia enterocolitica]